jgi:hypothetical protein
MESYTRGGRNRAGKLVGTMEWLVLARLTQPDAPAEPAGFGGKPDGSGRTANRAKMTQSGHWFGGPSYAKMKSLAFS